MENEYTSIRINKKLRDVLGDIGKKNETYEEVIIRLLKEAGYDIEVR